VKASLNLASGEFWANRAIAELALIQGAEHLDVPSVLAGGFPAVEDIDEFLKEIYLSRR
jgi:hypothetical protein